MQLEQGFGKNKVRYKNFDWHILESERLELHYEPEFEALAEKAMEYLEEGYDHISKILNHQLSHKPPIVIYQSPYEFQQTNILKQLLPPGVAGFAEPLRYRMVVPFQGDLDEFRSVLVHELTHIFQYDIIYRGPIKRLSNPLRAPPTWIMEGMAEYTTPGRNTIDELVLRDAVLTDRLIQLEQMDALWGTGNVFLAYKQSHSLMEYIAANYGPEKISRILRLWDPQTDTDKLLDRLIGMDMKELHERWAAHMRKQYWPLLQSRDYLTEIGRKIADADKYRMYASARWSLSGDMLVALSSDGIEQHVEIIRLRDGSLVERVTRGMRSTAYDHLTFGSGTVDWAPDGRTIAFVAKNGPEDVISLWDLYDKNLRKSLRFEHIELIESLAWSPDSRQLAFVGTGYGQSDIFIVEVETARLQQVTGTPQRDDYPAWSPDGRKLAFSSKHRNKFDIKIYELDTDRIWTAISSPTDDLWPQWLPEGNKLLFVSTREHQINDLFIYHLEEQQEYRLTQTLSGVMNPALSPDGRQIVLNIYHRGRYELYVLELPDWNQIQRRDAELRARAPAAQPETPRLEQYEPQHEPQPMRELSAVSGKAVLLVETSGSDKLLSWGEEEKKHALPKLDETVEKRMEVDDKRGGETDTGRSMLSRRRYTPKLEFDGIAVQMGYYNGFLSSIAQLSMSDLLGDHSLSLATDYLASQEISNDFNFAGTYSYYGQRPTYHLAVFSWNQYFNSNQLYRDTQGRLFRGLLRNQQRGAMANVAYPLDLYRRIDMSYTYVNEGESLIWPLQEDGPSISAHLFKTAYVHDSIVYGLLGPTVGRQYFLSVGRTLDLSHDHRSFSHLELDYRQYLRLGRWSVLGLRFTGVGSLGRNALEYNLGGPAWFIPFYTGFNLNVGPLRGYEYSEFTGSRVVLVNAEVRVPFIRQIVFGWPGTFAIPAVDGSMFFDVGTAWDKGEELELWPLHNPYAERDPEGQKRLRASFGFGTLVYFILPLNFEWAKQTDLRGNYSDWNFHFSFGKSF